MLVRLLLHKKCQSFKLRCEQTMIPPTMENYFSASTGASAALVGLIFVAISLWPKEKIAAASATWRAIAGGSFMAFVNAFLVSISALNPGLNLGWSVLTLSLIAVSNTLWRGFPLLRRSPNWKENLTTIIGNRLIIFAGLIAYISEGYFGVRLLLAPSETFAIEGIAINLILIYAIGLVHAWELLGIEQVGLRKWLSPTQSTVLLAVRDEDRVEDEPDSLAQE